MIQHRNRSLGASARRRTSSALSKKIDLRYELLERIVAGEHTFRANSASPDDVHTFQTQVTALELLAELGLITIVARRMTADGGIVAVGRNRPTEAGKRTASLRATDEPSPP